MPVQARIAEVTEDAAAGSLDETVLHGAGRPFRPDGGLKLLSVRLGKAVIKTSAVEPERHVVEAARASVI